MSARCAPQGVRAMRNPMREVPVAGPVGLTRDARVRSAYQSAAWTARCLRQAP
jgi:hypothetical protein